MGLIGRLFVVFGMAVAMVGTFLDIADVDEFVEEGFSLWEAVSRLDIAAAVIAAGTSVVAIIGCVYPRRALDEVALAGTGIVFGIFLGGSIESDFDAPGLYVPPIGSLIAVGGAVIALLSHNASASPPAGAGAHGRARQGSSPPGWYSDPAGSGRQRYWNGTDWTENLH